MRYVVLYRGQIIGKAPTHAGALKIRREHQRRLGGGVPGSLYKIVGLR